MPGTGIAAPTGELSPERGASACPSAGAGPCLDAPHAKTGAGREGWEDAGDGAATGANARASGYWMSVGYRPVAPGSTATLLRAANRETP